MHHELDITLYRLRLLRESGVAKDVLRFLKQNPTMRYTIWALAEGLYGRAYTDGLSGYQCGSLRASLYKGVQKLERAGVVRVVSDGRKLWVQAAWRSGKPPAHDEEDAGQAHEGPAGEDDRRNGKLPG